MDVGAGDNLSRPGTKGVANALLPVYEAAFLNVAIGRS